MMSEIEQNIWGFTPEGEVALIYTLRNASGGTVQLTNLGAAVVSITVPDRQGALRNVVLGYDRSESYRDDRELLVGKTIGRYAGVIPLGRFSVGSTDYKLPLNAGRNHINGGKNGFASKSWESRIEGDRVVFSYVSAAGEEGYPGEFGCEVAYDWNDDNQLEIIYIGKATEDTPVNLTTRLWFNLTGSESGSATEQQLEISGVGSVDPELGACYRAHDWRKNWMRQVLSLRDATSGRLLKIYSTMPSVCICGSEQLQGYPCDSGVFEGNERIGIECRYAPEPSDIQQFNDTILSTGHLYEEHTIYEFSAE